MEKDVFISPGEPPFGGAAPRVYPPRPIEWIPRRVEVEFLSTTSPASTWYSAWRWLGHDFLARWERTR